MIRDLDLATMLRCIVEEIDVGASTESVVLWLGSGGAEVVVDVCEAAIELAQQASIQTRSFDPSYRVVK